MPELPEVETIRQDLKNKIVNKKITNILVTEEARTNLSRNKFVSELKNKIIKDIDRIGKLIIIVLPNKKYLLVHLKMTGQLIYAQGKKIIAGGHPEPGVEELPNKFTRVEIDFRGEGKLFFNDIRRFGYLNIVGEEELSKIKSKFGIEPLQSDFTLFNFKKALKGKKTNIKVALLNQKLFAGIGNIYADEVCFLAGVRPDKKIEKLTNVEIKKLYSSIQKVIKKAIEQRGTTFNDYVDSEGKSGYFGKFLKVYARAGLKCKRCSGIIEKIKLTGRGTHFCPKCQK